MPDYENEMNHSSGELEEAAMKQKRLEEREQCYNSYMDGTIQDLSMVRKNMMINVELFGRKITINIAALKKLLEV